jgi:O-succinylbenzoate synthase
LLILRTELPISDTLDDLKSVAAHALDRGAEILHVSISPGWDRDPLETLRNKYPTVRLVANAKGSYHPSETDHLLGLSDLRLDGLVDPFGKAENEHTAALAAAVTGPTNRARELDIWTSVSSWKELADATQAGVDGVVVTADSFGGFRTLLDVVTHCAENSMNSLMTTPATTMLGAGQTAILAAATGIEPGPMTQFFGRWGRDIVKPGWSPGKAGLRLPGGNGNGLTVDRPYLKRQARRSELIN